MTAITGAVIILGLAFKGGWLTRFAGAVALVAFTLVVIQMGREGSLDTLQDVGMGLWLVLAGGVLALIGGFFPSTRTVAASTATTDTDTDDDCDDPFTHGLAPGTRAKGTPEVHRDPAVYGRVTVILVPLLSPSGSWLLAGT